MSDRLAYHHFINANAVRENPSASDRMKRDLRLGRIGLSDEDRQALVAALTGVHEELESIGRSMGGSPMDRAMAKQRRTEVFELARGRVDSAMSSDGTARLNHFINTHVKPRIKIYGAAID